MYSGNLKRRGRERVNLYLKPLTFTINKSFHEGIFTDELKLAKIIAMYKSGSPMDLSNYRPIYVLNIYSKILEILMYNRLIQYLYKNNVLYQNQFGFRQGNSTHHTLITLVDNITKSLDNTGILPFKNWIINV